MDCVKGNMNRRKIETMTSQATGGIKGNRVIGSHKENIDRTPEGIFPLLCPVQEYKWIDGWDCEIIYSSSDGVENNCIFKEDKSGIVLFGLTIPTFWTVSDYDPINYKIQFVLMSGQIAISKIEIDIKDVGSGKSSVSWGIVITVTGEDTNGRIIKSAQDKATMYLMVLSKALKHYCETGEMLSLNKATLIKIGFSVGVLDMIKNHIKGLSLK
jgi:hypothetical protein